MNETETQTLLRRAREALNSCRQQEADCRYFLASAEKATRAAKEKYEKLFAKEEAETVARIRSGKQ